MDRLSDLIGKNKKKNIPPAIEIDSDESKDAYGDEIQLLPIPSAKKEQQPPSSPRGRSYSLYDMGCSVSRRPPKSGHAEQPMSLEIFKPDYISTGTLPKFFRRSDRRLRRLNTELLEAIRNCNKHKAERFLHLGANPNATCHLVCVSAFHLAAFAGGETLPLLINSGAESKRVDRCGRTPLHLAAWSGNIAEIAILLDFPKDIQLKLKQGVTLEIERELINLSETTRAKIDVGCRTDEVHSILSKDWLDNIDHHCRDLQKSLPLVQPGWTALHAASSNAKYKCARLLIAAGAELSARDYVGRTPLDVVGSMCYEGHNIDPKDFTEIVKLLLICDIRKSKIMELKPFDTPLHTAIEVGSLEAITELLSSGATVTRHNRNGLTPLHVCVNKKLKEHLQVLANYDYSNTRQFSSVVDARNKNGHTVLHAAVLAGWAPGVCVCIEAGANVIAKDNDGETPIHLAAALGNLDILHEIISVAKQGGNIDFRNANGETALFKAVMHGHLASVQKLLKEGASIKVTLPKKENVFHIAAELGSFDILKTLLDHDYTITRSSINSLTEDDKKGFGPIHFATWNNHAECVKLLLSKNAYVSLKTSYGLHKQSTPLHLAAIKNNLEILKILYRFDRETIHSVDVMNWTPLHTASHNKSRDVVLFLLQKGADLSVYTDGPNKMKITCIEMIMNNFSKPTEFIEEVFDSCIINNKFNLQDSNFDTTLDYRVLLPVADDSNQMKVLQALVNTGNTCNQRRLLLHPLIESFLYLKWKGLVPYFYATVLLYGIFVIALTLFIITNFYYRDKNENHNQEAYNCSDKNHEHEGDEGYVSYEKMPFWVYNAGYSCVVVIYISAFLLIIQEILHVSVGRFYYFRQLETWIKFSSIILASILPYCVGKMSAKINWTRHVATATLLLSWFQMMFLLARFPSCGYYVLMFKKVSINVLKILLTFAFVLIGFSLSFMIEFHSKTPFEHPLAAFVKTMVMMTSEFDYDDLVSNKSLKHFTSSFLSVRIMFLIFLILTSIVLMNLMVGVAVNDLHNLQVQGNIQRLKMQVEFLTSLETLVRNNVFKKLLPNRLRNKLVVPKILSIYPNNSTGSLTLLPPRLRESAFNVAQNHKKQMHDHVGSVNIDRKLNVCKRTLESCNIHSQIDTKLKNGLNEKDAVEKVKDLELALSGLKNEMKQYNLESKHSNQLLNAKIDCILKKLDNIPK